MLITADISRAPHCARLLALLVVLMPSAAQAQSSAPGWLAQELLWASSSPAIAQASTASPTARVTLASDDTLDAASERALSRRLGRYRTMQVAGSVLVATTSLLGFVSIPLQRSRREHQGSWGRDSCAPNVFPFVAAAAFGAGLTVALIGTRRGGRLLREHGSVAPSRAAWRAALAGLGVLTATGIVASSLATTSLCNS